MHFMVIAWRRFSSSSGLILGAGQLRRTWQLVLITWLGMIMAVMLICTIPLYVRVVMTSGLGNVLKTLPDSTYVTIHTSNQRDIDRTPDGNSYAHTFDAQVASIPAIDALQTSFTTGVLPLFSDGPPRLIPGAFTCSQVKIAGYMIKQVAPTVKLSQGRLPQERSKDLEVAVTESTASMLHLNIGSPIYLNLRFASGDGAVPSPSITLDQRMTLRVVGIFTYNAKDVLWHGSSLDPELPGDHGPGTCTAMASMDEFIPAFQHLEQRSGAVGLLPQITLNGDWYYHINASRLDITTLEDLISALKQVDPAVIQYIAPSEFGYRDAPIVGTPAELLQAYNDRAAIGSIPIMTLTFLILGLALFFLILMIQILIERQGDTIALLRSRGASRLQIFSVFALPCFVLALVALMIGPLLALAVTHVATYALIPSANWSALHVLDDNPKGALLSVSGFALMGSGITVCVLLLTLFGTTRRDILALRREAARSRQRPFWQHFYLDAVAALVGLTGYGYVTYISNAGGLDQQTAQLIVVPLTLITTVFFLLASAFLLMRGVPRALHLGSRLLGQSRGFAAALALAQMERSPQQAMRTLLFLAFTMAFALLSLLFLGTQAQRQETFAAYQVGADFSGALNVPLNSISLPIAQQTASYQHLPGVLSASIGHVSEATSTSDGHTVQIQAIDPSTYANTTIWTTQSSQQPLSTLMQQLTARRKTATQSQVIPAVVDSALWQILNLSIGKQFSLTNANGIMQYVALAQVSRFPALAAGAQADQSVADGNMLIDYQTYSDVGSALYVNSNYPPNQVWLRTVSDQRTLNQLRSALSSGPLKVQTYEDRWTLLMALQNDPVALGLKGAFLIGMIATLLLALIGSIITTWQQARQRLTNWIVLRTLGTSSRQVIAVLLWEQGVVYGLALALGAVLGLVFSVLALPVLVFTSVANNQTSSANFFYFQTEPPIQIIAPLQLMLAPLVLIVLYAGTIWITQRLLLRLSLGQGLRLSED